MTIDKSFIDSFSKSTARAAYGASFFRGKNDKIGADKAAVDEMRKCLNTIDMSGVVVIGEGELDEAPMLYINEKLGTNKGEELDIFLTNPFRFLLVCIILGLILTGLGY